MDNYLWDKPAQLAIGIEVPGGSPRIRADQSGNLNEMVELAAARPLPAGQFYEIWVEDGPKFRDEDLLALFRDPHRPPLR